MSAFDPLEDYEPAVIGHVEDAVVPDDDPSEEELAAFAEREAAEAEWQAEAAAQFEENFDPDENPELVAWSPVLLAERNVLGAAMLAADSFEAAAQIIDRNDFLTPQHAVTWDAIAILKQTQRAGEELVPDVSLVAADLERSGLITTAGGVRYLVSLTEGVVPANAARYAENVRTASQQRRLSQIAEQLALAGATPMEVADRDAAISRATADLEELSAASGNEDPIAIVASALDETIDLLDSEEKFGVSTGIADLDELLGGLSPGQVIVVGARPATGKTVVALSIAHHVAGTLHRPALMFTLEMSRREMLTRVLASECRVNSRHLNLARPAMTAEDWERLSRGIPRITKMPLHVSDDASITPARMNALIGEFKRQNPEAGVVVIDYLQLMRGDGRANSRQEEVSEISRSIKLMAMRHNLPIVLLSQLNRKSEDRADKRPAMSDLRESGSVEQDADVVILLHREDQGDPESPRAGELDLIVEKNRSGPNGTATVAAQLHYYRLANMPGGA